MSRYTELITALSELAPCEEINAEILRTRIYALGRAKNLVRELFPPMAKALVWDGRKTGGYWVRLNPHHGNYSAFFWDCCMGLAKSEDTAKELCEAHHQNKFKELLA